MSKSGCPFDLQPVSPVSFIGHDAPTLAALMHRGIRFKKMTTKRSKATPSVAAATLAQAFKVKSLVIFIIPISAYTHTILSGRIDHNWNIIGNFALHRILLFLMNFQKYFLPLYSTCKIFILHTICSKKPVYRQEPKMFKHRVSMPPSQQPLRPKSNARPQKIPRPSQAQPKRQKAAPSSPPQLAP